MYFEQVKFWITNVQEVHSSILIHSPSTHVLSFWWFKSKFTEKPRISRFLPRICWFVASAHGTPDGGIYTLPFFGASLHKKNLRGNNSISFGSHEVLCPILRHSGEWNVWNYLQIVFAASHLEIPLILLNNSWRKGVCLEQCLGLKKC